MKLAITSYHIHAGRNTADKFVSLIRLTGKDDQHQQMDIYVNFADDCVFDGKVVPDLGQLEAPGLLWVVLPARDLNHFYKVLRLEGKVNAEWDVANQKISWFRIAAR